MPKIHVTTREGLKQVLDAEIGKKVMEVIRDNGIEDLEAICGGSCACATCHVYIDSSLTHQLPEPSPDEQILLEGSEHYKPGGVSRLSCQIMVSPEIADLTLAIAPEG